MFKRLELEAWTNFVPFVAFFLTFAVFLVVTIRALRLHRDNADELAALPLDLDAEPATQKTQDR